MRIRTKQRHRTYLLKFDLAQDLLGAIKLHAHQLVLRLKREEFLEVPNRLFVSQRLEVTCRPPVLPPQPSQAQRYEKW